MEIIKLTRSVRTASDRIILPGVVSEVVRPAIPAPDMYVVATRVSDVYVSDRILGLGLSRTPHHISNPEMRPLCFAMRRVVNLSINHFHSQAWMIRQPGIGPGVSCCFL